MRIGNLLYANRSFQFHLKVSCTGFRGTKARQIKHRATQYANLYKIYNIGSKLVRNWICKRFGNNICPFFWLDDVDAKLIDTTQTIKCFRIVFRFWLNPSGSFPLICLQNRRRKLIKRAFWILQSCIGQLWLIVCPESKSSKCSKHFTRRLIS